MIDIRKLKELVRLMVSNDLTELDLRDNEEQVTLRRDRPGSGGGGMPAMMHSHAAHAPAHMMMGNGAAPQMHHAGGGMTSSGAGSAGFVDDNGADDDLITIESPMVGTFYSSQNPDSPPFVSVGSNVSDDTVVCLVEAMKIFNELKAECSGTIAKVLVKNGEAVEFGQPLFTVKPD